MTTHERAVEVDTELARIWAAQQDAETRGQQALENLHHALRHETRWEGRRRVWLKTATETIAEARAALSNDRLGSYRAESARHALEVIDAARAEREVLRAQSGPLEVEYAENRWTRFFLVTNPNGHIHSSMACSTTFPTTSWSWLPQLSGLIEDAAVADQGPRLCSVCFPSAPVEWTVGLVAKVDPDRCPGSGREVPPVKAYSRWGSCPVCHRSFARSSTGKLRAHKTPKEA